MTVEITKTLLLVTPEDREAAADYLKNHGYWYIDPDAYLAGKMDGVPLVQAFARHRQTHSLPGDVGTAICSECDGKGSSRLPQNRIRIMTNPAFNKIAEGLNEAIKIAESLSKFLPEDLFPDKDDVNPKVLGRVELWRNGLFWDYESFERGDWKDMGMALETIMTLRDSTRRTEPDSKFKIKIKDGPYAQSR